MSYRDVIFGTLCVISGAALAALLSKNGVEDQGQLAALQRRIDALETKAATPTPVRVLNSSQQPELGSAPQRSLERGQSHSNALLQQPTAPPALEDETAAAERRRSEAGVFERVLAGEG